MDSKQGSIDCRDCGTLRTSDYGFSHRGLCPDCGETHLVENLHGLTDPQSVPYKNWRFQWEVSAYGRPRNTTPPPAWIPNMSSLQVRHALPDRY